MTSVNCGSLCDTYRNRLSSRGRDFITNDEYIRWRTFLSRDEKRESIKPFVFCMNYCKLYVVTPKTFDKHKRTQTLSGKTN